MLKLINISCGDIILALAGQIICTADPAYGDDAAQVKRSGESLSRILGIPLETVDMPMPDDEEWTYEEVVASLPSPENGWYLVKDDMSVAHIVTGITPVGSTPAPSPEAVRAVGRSLDYYGEDLLHKQCAAQAEVGAWYWKPSKHAWRALVTRIEPDGRIFGRLDSRRWNRMSLQDWLAKPETELQTFCNWRRLKNQPEPGQRPD